MSAGSIGLGRGAEFMFTLLVTGEDGGLMKVTVNETSIALLVPK